ncbi:S-layer homology domain-containing protein [Paenibacillus pasadenensis]|uniref:S-layer homology domain-containing protein n=1 Tax=Paenibacillus pasadenensis TaxID=217090 RepID=UPI002042541F|nr:S-layer homology domain-containing protein [Paenibacillus pasadenensis]MCM3745861.1 S-layer homology domain-containing protein [Paenibacillus pasadenensis]
MATWKGEVYAVWQERVVPNSHPSQIRVKKYNGSSWISVDGNGPNGLNVNPLKAGTRPALVAFGDVLYVAWSEVDLSYNDQIRIKKYDGISWTSAEGGSSGGLNVDATKDATFPNLAVYNNELFATWSEAGQIRVKKYDGTEWTSVDGGGANGINAGGGGFPVMAVLGNHLYIVWSEVTGSNYQLRVKRYDGGNSWTFVDNSATGLNMVSSSSALYPSVAVLDNVLYVAWHEPIGRTDDQIRVKKYDGTTWTSIDGGGQYGINVSSAFRANYVKLAVVDNNLYAVWQEHYTGVLFKIRVKKYDGTTWTSAEANWNGLNVNATKTSIYPAVSVVNDVLYVAWQEKNNTAEQVRVANYTPPPPPAVNSVSVVPARASVAQGGTRQLSASVVAVGGAATTVTWTSSDIANKVTVNSAGKVTVAADAELGEYTITATSTADTSKKGTSTITVTHAPAVNSVTVTPSSGSVEQGSSKQLAVSVDVLGGAATTVSWTSSDVGNKVKVNSTGKVTVAADAEPRDYTITATSTVDNSKKGTSTITVTHAPAVNSVTVTPSSASVEQGTSKQLAVSVDAVGGAAQTVTWTSSDIDNKVTVNSTGKVTVAADAAPGDYIITATSTVDNSKKGTSTITVTEAPTYAIAAIEDQTLTALTRGYDSGSQETRTIPVINSGTGKLENLSAALSGANVNDFVITQPESTLTSSASTSFDIKVKDDLPAGTYTGTVILTADNLAPVSFTVSQAVNLENAPANPQNLAVVGGDRQATLSWNAVPDADRYRIYMATNTNFNDAVEVATVTSSTYSVQRLVNGTPYYFIVKSENAGGLSEASNQAFVIPATIPGAPINVTAIAGNGQALVTFTAPIDNGGSAITGYEVTVSPGFVVVTGGASPITITGLTNGARYTFTVKAINGTGKSVSSAESNAITPEAPDTPDNPSQPSTPTTPKTENKGVDILVNGKVENAGTAIISKRNEQSELTVVVDQKKLDERLAAEGQHAVVTIPISQKFDIVIGELNGQMVKNMEDKEAVLEFKTDYATYTLPARQINIGAISKQIGTAIALRDIKIQIEISVPTADTLKLVEHAAAKGELTLVAQPLDFKVKSVYGDKIVEVSNFDAYVERTIAIPDGVDPSKIPTGVVVEKDGSVRHVPTKISTIDGKYVAQINSLTNSTYGVVWHPLEFSDMANHWAKNAVNNMGSRMVVEGTGNGMFSPNMEITRAEFAAIITRGLGLKLDNSAAPFSDVKSYAWYNGAANTAYTYGLINGFEDGTFRPNEKITREQAMVILSKAMSLTGLKDKLPEQSTEAALNPFTDAVRVASWAQNSVAINVRAGIVLGRNGALLAPKGYITRAEVAAIIQRLLQKSDLI